MIANTIPFRDLDRKWFLLENKKDIKRINKLFHLKKKGYPLLSFCYIDHEEGISLRILGTIEVENKIASLDQKYLDSHLDILRYSEMELLDLTPVPDELARKIKGTDTVIEEMNQYYDPYEKMLSTRQQQKLDESRDKIKVDNVKFLLLDRTHRNEFVIGRIEEYQEEKDVYYAEVLTQPTQDFQVNIGDYVWLKYVDRPNYKGLAFMKKEQSEMKTES